MVTGLGLGLGYTCSADICRDRGRCYLTWQLKGNFNWILNGKQRHAHILVLLSENTSWCPGTFFAGGLQNDYFHHPNLQMFFNINSLIIKSLKKKNWSVIVHTIHTRQRCLRIQVKLMVEISISSSAAWSVTCCITIDQRFDKHMITSNRLLQFYMKNNFANIFIQGNVVGRQLLVKLNTTQCRNLKKKFWLKVNWSDSWSNKTDVFRLVI